MNITMRVNFTNEDGVVSRTEHVEILRINHLLFQFLADNEIVFDHAVDLKVTVNE